MSTDLTVFAEPVNEFPPILAGNDAPDVKRRAERFYLSVAEMFEAWVQRRPNPNTQRTYRTGVMAFVRFMEIEWPSDAWRLLRVNVPDVQAWRDEMLEQGAAPKTLRSISSAL